MKRLGPLRRALVDLHTGALKVVILYNRQEDGLSHETSLPLRLVIAPRQTHNPPIGFPWPPPHLLLHSLQPKPRQPQPTAVSNPYFSVTTVSCSLYGLSYWVVLFPSLSTSPPGNGLDHPGSGDRSSIKCYDWPSAYPTTIRCWCSHPTFGL